MKDNKNLFLDDIRLPLDTYLYTKNLIYIKLEWDVVRNYNEFVKYIEENGIPDIISFDHDLADEHYAPEMYHGKEAYDKVHDTFVEKTGYECAKWLVDYCILNNVDLPKYEIHSMNPVGRLNIDSYLKNFEKFK